MVRQSFRFRGASRANQGGLVLSAKGRPSSRAMAEQWIAAATARNLVIDPPNEMGPVLTLLSRAHAGMVRARANLLIIGDQRTANMAVPKEFWWAEGHEALEQDWTTGDFATWIDGSTQWRAYGVSFSLDGVLGMLPLEKRAVAAHGVSVVGNAAWLNAKAARRFAHEKAKLNPNHAADAIIDACLLGFVMARAVLMRRADVRRPEDWTADQREWDVPQWFWETFGSPVLSDQDWERGVFSGKVAAPDGPCWIRLDGVHFLGSSLQVLMPVSSNPETVTAPAMNPGGRPPKGWWDDLWCAVWGQAYHGDLKPKRQADVERAMIDWAEQHGHSVSESVVRPLARKMFAAMTSEAENL